MSHATAARKGPPSTNKGISVQITTFSSSDTPGGKRDEQVQSSQTTIKPPAQKSTQFYPQRPKQQASSTTTVTAASVSTSSSSSSSASISVANATLRVSGSRSSIPQSHHSADPDPDTNANANSFGDVEDRIPARESVSADLSRSSVVPASKAVQDTLSTEQLSDDHPLHNEWCAFFDYPHKKMTSEIWKQNVKHVATLDSVENFWRLHNNMQDITQLQNGSNFHFFKKGIFPEWEDPANANGGKWVHIVPPTDRFRMNDKWMNLLMSCIGEMFEHSDEVCGCVVNVRTKDSRIALWIRESKNAQVVSSIGRQLREFMKLEEGNLIKFFAHDLKSENALSLEL